MAIASTDPHDRFWGRTSYALVRDGAAESQILEAINAGNNMAQAVSPNNYWITNYEFAPSVPVIGNGQYSVVAAAQPAQVTYPGGAGPTDTYMRYGYNFASGSAPSNTENVIGPTGTAGAYTATYTLAVASWGPQTSNTFTDIVVSIDGNNAFGGFAYNGLNFPSVGALVEAARRNLENNAASQAAGLDLNALGFTTEFAPIAIQAGPPLLPQTGLNRI